MTDPDLTDLRRASIIFAILMAAVVGAGGYLWVIS